MKWAVKEFEFAIRTMMANNSSVHMFDFDGTTNGIKEPWSFLIAVGPKKSFAQLEKQFGSAPISGERPPSPDIPTDAGSPT